jgi:hypothetical protein
MLLPTISTDGVADRIGRAGTGKMHELIQIGALAVEAYVGGSDGARAIGGAVE